MKEIYYAFMCQKLLSLYGPLDLNNRYESLLKFKRNFYSQPAQLDTDAHCSIQTFIILTLSRIKLKFKEMGKFKSAKKRAAALEIVPKEAEAEVQLPESRRSDDKPLKKVGILL